MKRPIPSGSAGSRDTAAPGRTYAVAWQRDDEGTVSGSLRADRDGLHLLGRSGAFHIPFVEVARLSIERSRIQRLKGLPAISLALARGANVRIASAMPAKPSLLPFDAATSSSTARLASPALFPNKSSTSSTMPTACAKSMLASFASSNVGVSVS